MKISEETLHTLIWSFAEVNVYSPTTGADYYIKYIGDQKYAVTYFLNKKEGNKAVTKIFNSFRNGDTDSPDFEGFLPYWVDTLNSRDCYIDISDSADAME